ncbi:hypothetical protein H6P81_021700 [Aristolochia fimbriata]|uniref:Uncharacterized protein n=1 Tax=Aristolochia fimbriata TaxID=158543 RepID=A0AAV7DP91_ARIFI|nr:hypothetical protein H6P81_021700 [Aristolochia fimbriata]
MAGLPNPYIQDEGRLAPPASLLQERRASLIVRLLHKRARLHPIQDKRRQSVAPRLPGQACPTSTLLLGPCHKTLNPPCRPYPRKDGTDTFKAKACQPLQGYKAKMWGQASLALQGQGIAWLNPATSRQQASPSRLQGQARGCSHLIAWWLERLLTLSHTAEEGLVAPQGSAKVKAICPSPHGRWPLSSSHKQERPKCPANLFAQLWLLIFSRLRWIQLQPSPTFDFVRGGRLWRFVGSTAYRLHRRMDKGTGGGDADYALVVSYEPLPRRRFIRTDLLLPLLACAFPGCLWVFSRMDPCERAVPADLVGFANQSDASISLPLDRHAPARVEATSASALRVEAPRSLVRMLPADPAVSHVCLKDFSFTHV